MLVTRKTSAILTTVIVLLLPGQLMAQAVVPPHLLGDLSDFKPMIALTGFLVGLIPALIFMKSAEAIAHRWDNAASRTVVISFMVCAICSLIATVWFWGWVL